MSRRIENSGFVSLIKERSVLLNEKVEAGDIVCLAETSRMSLRRYLSGSASHQRLELRLAGIFQISVPELRKRIGLPKPQKTTRRKLRDQGANSRAL